MIAAFHGRLVFSQTIPRATQAKARVSVPRSVSAASSISGAMADSSPIRPSALATAALTPSVCAVSSVSDRMPTASRSASRPSAVATCMR